MDTSSRSTVKKRPSMRTLQISLIPTLALLVYAAPEFGNFTKVSMIPESITYNERLSIIYCSDSNGRPTRSYVLTVVPPTPCGKCFDIFSCPDANISIKAHHTPAGTKIFNVDAEDRDNDDIIYTLKVLPTSSAGHYRIDSLTGEIVTTVDMRSECDRNVVSLLVTISDGKNKVGPLVIDVLIENPNISPRAVNLDTIVQIPETSKGTAYKMMFLDDNIKDVFYTVTSVNSAGLAQYAIDGRSPNVDIPGTLNYETSALRTTVLDIQLNDGYCLSPKYKLTLSVTDVNEPPSIVPSVVTVEICEGQREFNPGFRVIDEDAYDVHKWSISKLTSDRAGHFDIDPSNGVIRTLLDYDVDMAAMLAKRKIIVQGNDKGDLTATATVDITFLDCNDNAPVFNSANYTAAATECTAAGSVLIRVTATDRDSSREMNNLIHYSGSGGAVYLGSGGEVIVAQAMPAGTVLTFYAYAYDRGQTPSPLKSVHPTVVSVRFTKCPTPPPSTTTPVPTTSHFVTTTETLPKKDENTAWIIIASLLGTAGLGLMGYMVWRYGSKCLNACRRMDCELNARRARRSFRRQNVIRIKVEPETRKSMTIVEHEPPSYKFIF